MLRTIGRVGWQDCLNICLLLLVAVVLTVQYFLAVELQDMGESMLTQHWILVADIGSPYRYRLLVPYLTDALMHLVWREDEPLQIAFVRAYALFDLVSLSLLLVSLYALVRAWFSSARSLVAVLFTAGVMPITFSYYSYQPWWILEVAFTALGLLFAHRRKYVLLGATVALAALNRETGIFLPAALFIGQIRSASLAGIRGALSRRDGQIALAYVLLSVAIFWALRVARGDAGPVDQLVDVLWRNLELEHTRQGALAVLLFLGAGWAFAALGYASAPPFLRGAARIVPLYLLVFFVWGWWREARILTTLYPFLLPLIACYCASRTPAPDQQDATTASRGAAASSSG